MTLPSIVRVKRPKETNYFINGGLKPLRSNYLNFMPLLEVINFLITSQCFHMNAFLQHTYKNNSCLFLCVADRDTFEEAGAIINFIHLQLFVLHYTNQILNSSVSDKQSLTLVSVPRSYFKCKYNAVIMQNYVSAACLIDQRCSTDEYAELSLVRTHACVPESVQLADQCSGCLPLGLWRLRF